MDNNSETIAVAVENIDKSETVAVDKSETVAVSGDNSETVAGDNSETVTIDNIINSEIVTINDIDNLETVTIDNIIIKINNKYVKFYKCNNLKGAISLYFKDKNNKYFLKIPIKYDHCVNSDIVTITNIFNLETTTINNMIIKINNKYVKFYQCSNLQGATSLYFKDKNNKYFLKIPIKYTKYDILKREVFILKKLQKYKHFPRLVKYSDYYIITEYIGDTISKDTIPENIFSQINKINNIFKKENIIHADIKNSEMLIKNNILYIIDFGWSKFNNTWCCLKGFCDLEKPGLDKTSDLDNMINIILQKLKDDNDNDKFIKTIKYLIIN